ncbi:MAG TPA: DUF2169 domain-containing protein [Sandaracinaceae bacterium LLY-WYZ-13_1]|nr:DUF2169 domain-containing protein [Sandaracinaceae bacterium LLY-WYZ-13_1]
MIPHLDDVDGSLLGVVLIKERFVASRRGEVTRAGGAEIHVADEPWDPDAPETSSIRRPSDLCTRKPSTDVVVAGSAMAPYRERVRELAVGVRVGPVRKSLRVFGPRAWYRRGVGEMALTAPEPFERVPVRWEHAWGGADYETDPERPLEEPRNPNGCGLVADPDALEGTLGPQVEDPADPIRNHRSRPRPAGLGAIGRHWAPRRDHAGTMDDAWMEERMPLLPLDFDPRFNQCAPPDLVAPAPLRGGEPVEVMGMHAEGPFAFALPRLRFFVGLQTADRLTEHPPQLDTVLLEPDERAVTLTWRSVVKLPRSQSRMRFVQVHEKRIA